MVRCRCGETRLHPDSVVVGIDIYDACKQYEEEGIQSFVGAQSVTSDIGPVDFIPDDAGPSSRPQIDRFEALFQDGLRHGGV